MEFTFTATEVATILGFSVGLLWGESFSGFDGQIKYETQWFQNLDPFTQWLVASILDATHHFQYGLAVILWVITRLTPGSTPYTLLLWLGWGLVVSDWKDYRNVLRRLGINGEDT